MSEFPVHRRSARSRILGKSAVDAADHAERPLSMAIELSLIGLLLALNIMLRFPEIGALVAQYNQF